MMKDLKKILITCSDLQIGGMQKSLVEFISYLITLGQYDIDLMVWEEGELKNLVPKEVNIILQKYPPTINRIKNEKNWLTIADVILKYVKYKWFSIIIKKPWKYYSPQVKNYDFSIAFTHKGFPMFFVIDNVKAKRKFVWFHHGSYEQTESPLNHIYFKSFDNIIAVSKPNQKILLYQFPSLREKLLVIPNIINSASIIRNANAGVENIKKKSGEIYLTTVSRISPEKGIDISVRIAAELKKRNLSFKWFFVGDGEMQEEIKFLAKKLDVLDVCIFVGNKYNPYPYIKMADIYVQTSRVEAHPLTINEALVLKKRIVATDIPSIMSVLQDGKLGILSSPDPEIFADHILNLVFNKDMGEILDNNVNKHIVSNETAYYNIDELFTMYS